jgi:hypothetical protein
MNYLSPSQCHAALNSIEYRHPGVNIEMFWHPYEGYQGCCIAITFAVPNSYKQGEQQTQRVNVPVPPIVSVVHFLDWLRWRLSTIALHEVNEMLWVTGENTPRVDPHSAEYWDLRTP